ncbi:MAG TPA: glycosyltransferase [Anaerolineae bacterium]|nr:glycosyltransferase [Anaerolineae bacterium]HNU04661.1 glycosyltransferase [Anaerolineae bacterium]
MRILTVGPVGVVPMQRVLGWLAAAGAEVWVVDENDTYRELAPAGFRFSALAQPDAASAPDASLDAAAAALRQIAAQFQPQLVHVQNVTALGLACLRAGLGPLLVSTWGALGQAADGERVSLSAAARQLLAAADALIVDAPTLLAPARGLARPGARVELLPMGADMQRFRPGRTEEALLWRTLFGIPDEAFVLLSPRMWGAFYGHQAILTAYALAWSRFARPTRLALVGLGDGPAALPHMAEAWQGMASTPAAQAVRWLPRISYRQMPTLYALSDAVLNYPEVDSFPATLVEAAACQLPVITPLLPTYRETFVEQCCTLAQPGDPAALAEAMVQVVNQPPAERAARLAQARAAVERDYDDALIAGRLWALCEELARGA